MFRFALARSGALTFVLLVVPSACASDEAVTTTTSSPATTPTTTAEVAATSSSTTLPAETTTTNEAVRVIEVTYASGQVAGGAQRTTVRLGEKVRLRVTSDVADQIHLHTYDLKAPVGPGLPAQIDLIATIPGRHEVELEKKRRQLLVLEVK